MRVLIACEFSGTVRDAFLARDHEALSCDLLPTESPGPHYQGDVRDVLRFPWDLIIAHPPCTDLAVSGARHFPAKKLDGRQYASASFFMELVNATAPRIVVENPISVMSSLYRRPDQIIHPWQFGHGETKATCLWLKGCPPYSRHRLWRAERPSATGCHQARTDGSSAAKHTKGSPPRWRNSGED